MGLCSIFFRFQNSWGFTVSVFFCSYAEALSHFINDCCSNRLLVAWEKNMPQWNFLAVFKTAGQIFKGKCICACWTGQRQVGRDAALGGTLYGGPGCGPAAVFWGNLGYFALLCWWSAFLTVGMLLLSNAELLLGWIIHRVISCGRDFQHSIRLFFFFF